MNHSLVKVKSVIGLMTRNTEGIRMLQIHLSAFKVGMYPIEIVSDYK